MIKLKTRDFSLGKVMHSLPFYFFYSNEPKRRVFLNGRFVNLVFSQKNNTLIVEHDEPLWPAERTFLRNRIKYCFGLSEDYSGFYRLCKKDRVLKTILPKIAGTRMVSAFSDFEGLVGAVVSQNNSFRNYRAKMAELEPFGFVPKNFLKTSLSSFRLGYKVPYIKNVSRLFLESENPSLKQIIDTKGIGKYSLNLFAIFQRRDYSCFYWDCLTERILCEYYNIGTDEKGGFKVAQELWGDFRGLALACLQKFLNDTVK